MLTADQNIEHFFTKIMKNLRFSSSMWESFSHRLLFYIFVNFFQFKSGVRIILGHLRLMNGVRFLPPTKSEKNRPSKG